jgi:hypothetical protein
VEACSVTKKDQSIEREKVERRELEAAGWEPKGRGARTIWQSPTDGRWYAHYQAVEMQRKEGPKPEEERLLGEHGFERVSTDGTNEGRERWVRQRWVGPEEGPQLYTRSKALKKAGKESE